MSTGDQPAAIGYRDAKRNSPVKQSVVLLEALHIEAADPTAWLALADALEEEGEAGRGELVRLVTQLRTGKVEPAREERVRELLGSGVRPAVPEVVNSIGMRLALIPPGTFLMGSSPRERGAEKHERPRHEVEISRPFYLGVFQVTQAQYERVVGTNPSHFKGADLPVEQVSWDDAVEFCKRLSALPVEKQHGRAYRLPTEAEWEYACRGGASSSTPFYFGPSLSSTQDNFDGNHPYGGAARGPYLHRTCKVGSYRPNAWGLFDMHGNVGEWCSDWYDENYYDNSPRKDPTGPATGSLRVLRGGSWLNYGRGCRAACRSGLVPGIRNDYFGFRCVLLPQQSWP